MSGGNIKKKKKKNATIPIFACRLILYVVTSFWSNLFNLYICSILQIRLTEAQLQKTAQEDMKPEQLEKWTKLEGWHKELQLLEDKKAEMAAS